MGAMRISDAIETDGEAPNVAEACGNMVANMRKFLMERLGDLPSSWIGRVAYGLFLLAVLVVLIRGVVLML